MYGFQSYISMPIIRKDGSFFGTLCAIDPNPARLKTPEIIGMFKLFAELIASQLDADARLDASERMAELRDQFIAVLGHDLRNPIAALGAGTKMLQRTPLDTKSAEIVALMQNSVLRMAGLVDNLLDFARGRLGNGIIVARRPSDIAPVLDQVVDELRAANPARDIEMTLDLPDLVTFDPARIGQLFSNLFGNALTHGSPDGPVRISATTADGAFSLSSPMPAPRSQPTLSRSSSCRSPAAKTAIAASVSASTSPPRSPKPMAAASPSPRAPAETRFTFTMPL